MIYNCKMKLDPATIAEIQISGGRLSNSHKLGRTTIGVSHTESLILDDMLKNCGEGYFVIDEGKITQASEITLLLNEETLVKSFGRLPLEFILSSPRLKVAKFRVNEIAVVLRKLTSNVQRVRR